MSSLSVEKLVREDNPDDVRGVFSLGSETLNRKAALQSRGMEFESLTGRKRLMEIAINCIKGNVGADVLEPYLGLQIRVSQSLLL